MREISLHILDIAENALRAGASEIEIVVALDESADRLTVEVSDNGRGIAPELLKRVEDPFVTSRTERKVGLGLPLLAAACERTGGDLTIHSALDSGTRVCATFGLRSIDRAPMGALRDTVANLAAANPDVRVVLTVTAAGGHAFTFDSSEMKEALEGMSLSNPDVVRWMQGYLDEGIGSVCCLE